MTPSRALYILRILTCGASVLLLSIILTPILHDGYFPIDDDSLISIPQLRVPMSLSSLTSILTPGTHVDFYPVRDLSYWFDIHVLGADTTGSDASVFRWVNLVLLSASASFLLLILDTLVATSWVPWWVAFGWGIHPAHWEMVTWASGRKDCLAVFFGLWAVVAFRRFPWLSALLFGFSLLSKTSFALVPFAILAAVIGFGNQRRLSRSQLLALGAACALGMGSSLLQGWFYSQVNDMRLTLSASHRIGASVSALGKMASGWIWPSIQVIDVENWGTWLDFNSGWMPFGFLILGASAALAVISVLRGWVQGATLIMIALACYLPTAGLLFPHRNFYSVRYSEAWMLPAWIAAALLLAGRRSIIVYSWVALIGLLAFMQSANWESNLAIVRYGHQQEPRSISQMELLSAELANLNRWGRLNPTQRLEWEELKSQVRSHCDGSREDPANAKGDLCWSHWIIGYRQLHYEGTGIYQYLRDLGVLNRERQRREEAEIAIGSPPTSASLKRAGLRWLATHTYTPTPATRLKKWASLCALERNQEARDFLTGAQKNGLMDDTAFSEELNGWKELRPWLKSRSRDCGWTSASI